MPLLHLEPLPPRTSKGEILNLLCTAGGLRREQVGRIDLAGATAAVEVPAGSETRLVKLLDGAALKERRLRAWATPDVPVAIDPNDHFQKMARLLNLESEAEARQTLAGIQEKSATAAERTGESLVGLVIAEETSGLGGRCILTLARRNRTTKLPWNRLEPGAPILLSVLGAKDAEGCAGSCANVARWR